MNHWEYELGPLEEGPCWTKGKIVARNFDEALKKVRKEVSKAPRGYKQIRKLELVSVADF